MLKLSCAWCLLTIAGPALAFSSDNDPHYLLRDAGLATANGRYSEAEMLYRRALRAASSGSEKDWTLEFEALGQLSILSRIVGRIGEAEGLARRALALGARHYGPEDARLGDMYLNLGATLLAQRRTKEAERMTRLALRVWRPQDLTATLRRAAALSTMASILNMRRRFAESESGHREAIRLVETAGGLRHPALIPVLINFAEFCWNRKRYAESEQSARHALEIADVTVGRSHSDWAHAAFSVAESLAGQKRFIEAESYYRQAIDALDRAGASDLDRAIVLNGYARFLRGAGRQTEAESVEAEATAARTRPGAVIAAPIHTNAEVPSTPTEPRPCHEKSTGWTWSRSAVPGDLPTLVRKAIASLPFMEQRQIVVLQNASELSKYLVAWGYSHESVTNTIKDVAGLAEFTIDHHFPIFINSESPHYRRIVASWERGNFPDDAARVLASDIYHEYRHAACGEEEIDALDAQLTLLKRWRAEGRLRIADPYIEAKEAERRDLAAQPRKGIH